MSEKLPGRRDIEEWFSGLVAQTRARDEADRWAAQWFADLSAIDDAVVLWGLTVLYGIDLPDGPDGGFLHDDEQIRQWLAEFRQRCGPDTR